MAGLEPARILNGESVAQNPEGGLLPLLTEAMGVSVHSGEGFAGTGGSPRRSNYAAVGDTVNAASRLEELNRDLGTSIVMSGETIALLGNRVEVRRRGWFLVRGRSHPMQVFELLALRGSALKGPQ
jgi:adenylate cyclase